MPNPWSIGVQVKIVGTLHGSETNNIFNMGANFDVNVTPQTVQDKLVALGQAMLLCVRETLLPAVTSDWTFKHVEVRRVWPSPGDPIIATGLPTDVGELSATSVSFAASLVHLRTGQGGRRGRGRVFLPPPGEAQITASDIDDATMLLLAAFLACLAEKFMGLNPPTEFHLIVLSRTDAGPTNANFNNGAREVMSLNPVVQVAKIGSRKKGIGS